MSWIEAVHGLEGVDAVFSGAIPPLTRVELHSVTFGHGGDVRLVFDLASYPSRPPEKWAKQGFNTVQLTLVCTQVRDVRVTGWARQVIADIVIGRVDEAVEVRVLSPATSLTLSADIVSVVSVAAYLNDPSRACW
ncbi:MAG: Imm50 family immunity protein [Mycolicibacterium sp.]|uniref:Imm50 family immunity protein n=1 Tax=Mycolicibacterium sp. TaxID=2320850 RepID=UPI003D136FC8